MVFSDLLSSVAYFLINFGKFPFIICLNIVFSPCLITAMQGYVFYNRPTILDYFLLLFFFPLISLGLLLWGAYLDLSLIFLGLSLVVSSLLLSLS